MAIGQFGASTNKTTLNAASGASQTLTVTGTIAAGNLCVLTACVSSSGADANVAVSDTAGNAWTLIKSFAHHATTPGQSFLFATFATTGGPGIQITASNGAASVPWGISFEEYPVPTGLTASLDAGSPVAAGSGTPTMGPSAGAMTLAGTNELVLALAAIGGAGVNITSVSPLVTEAINVGSIVSGSKQYIFSSANGQSGSPTPTWATNVSEPYAACAAAWMLTGIISVSPNPVAPNQVSVTVTVTGQNTAWLSSSAAFNITGAGTTYSGSAVLTDTSAAVTFSTSATVGTATITDGTYSIPIDVSASGLSASPTVVAAQGSYTVNVAGTATNWTNPSGLFTVGGWPGAAISGITINSPSSATFTLALGATNASGTATITDTTTGETAPVAVEQAYGGSLHFGGQCLFQQTSGTLGLFSGRSNASLSFFLCIPTNAGLNLAVGTAILDWASGAATTAVAYKPATQAVTFTIPGTGSNKFVKSVPVQLGTGYHFTLVWTVGAQTLYLNGLPFDTPGSVATVTGALVGLQMGGDAGAGVALDHYLSDVAVYPGALDAADAAGLAARTLSPVTTSVPASAWWALGGGTAGANPVIAPTPDPWLQDLSGNGNGLSLASGSLANATYQAPRAISSPVVTSGQVSKSGTLAIFGVMQAQTVNNVNPGACISAVNARPTVYRNGTPCSVGPITGFTVTADTPFVAGLLGCGTVAQVKILDGGAYPTSTPPTPSAAGVVFGTPVMPSGITSYTWTAVASNYAQPPPVTFAGGGATVPATGHAIVWSGRVTAIVVDTPGNHTSAPSITVGSASTGSGASAAYTGTISPGGGLQLGDAGVAILTPGSGYPNGPAVTPPAPSGTSGAAGNTTAAAFAVVGDSNSATPGAVIAIVPLAGGRPGCGTGYAGSTVGGTIAASPNGQTPVVTGHVSNYVANIPVVSSGDSNAPPAITLSGGSPTRAAVVAPIMSGASPSDVFTYDAPASWLTANTYGNPGLPLGGLAAVTAAPMDNWTGRLEGATGGMASFAQTPSMIAGGNMGIAPIQSGSATNLAMNLLHKQAPWRVLAGSGAATYDQSGMATVLYWTSPASTLLYSNVYLMPWSNQIDGQDIASYFGPFTLRYDDSAAGTANAAAIWCYTGNTASNVVVTPVPQSGDPTPVTVPGAKATIAAGGITQIDLTGVAFANTYQGAGVIVSGGGGSGFAGTVNVVGGVPTSINVICKGSGYSTSGLVITVYGTAVSGHTITAVFDFEYAPNPSNWNAWVALYWAQPQGLNTITDPWLVPPVWPARTANTSFDRSDPLAVDANILAALTSAGRPIGIGRFMDRTLGGAAGSGINLALPSDLPAVASSTQWIGMTGRILGAAFPYARHLNTDPTKGPGVSLAGTTSSGQPQVTGISSTSALLVGMPAVGTGLPAGATIVSVDSSTQVTLSANATASGTPTIAFGGDGTYAGFSTKCYSHAAWANQFDPPYALSGSTTSGSPVVAVSSMQDPVSQQALMAGAGVSGPGVPAGAIVAFLGMQVIGTIAPSSAVVTGIASTSGLAPGMPVYGETTGNVTFATTIGTVDSATQITLSAAIPAGGPSPSGPYALNVGADRLFTLGSRSGGLANATATGSGVTLTVQGIGCVPLPAADDGYFMSNHFGSNHQLVWEMRSATPHGLRSGDSVAFAGDANIPPLSVILSRTAQSVECAYSSAGTLTNGSAVVTGLTAANTYNVGSPVVVVAATANVTLTNNSTDITPGVAGLAVGMGIVGAGIPYGTNIASFGSYDPGTGTGDLTMSAAAQVTGPPAAASLTFSYFPATATIASVQSSTQFTLTQDALTSGPATLVITGFALRTQASLQIMVTGPYTVAVVTQLPGGYTFTPPQASGPMTVVGGSSEIPLQTTAYPNGWVAWLPVPNTPTTSSIEPWEFGAAMTRQLPGMALHVNFPMAGSDDLVAVIAAKVAANAGPTTPMWLEWSNEPWNESYVSIFYLVSVSTLISYATSGTVLGKIPAPTETLTGPLPAQAAISGHACDVFTAAWTAAGKSASLVRGGQSGWFALSSGGLGNDPPGYLNTYQFLRRCMEWGYQPDVVWFAPYMDQPGDWPTLQAIAPAGSPFGTASGSWPVPALNDLSRFWASYSQGQWAQYAGQAQYLNFYGQPLEPAVLGQATGGGSIPAGAYYGYYTFVDGSGNETTVGLSGFAQGMQNFGLTLTAGNTLTIAMPAWPIWAQQINFYLSQPGAAPGATPLSVLPTLAGNVQAPITRSMYGQGHDYPVGQAVNFTVLPGTRVAPPTTNHAAANAKIPVPAAYEGGMERTIFGSIPFQFNYIQDTSMHPSWRDVGYCWFAMCQQGNPCVPNSGYAAASYFQAYGYSQYPANWALAVGTSMPPGPGLSNAFATIQGGQPADGHDHRAFNAGGLAGGVVAQSPGLQGLMDWVAGSAIVQSGQTRRIRWFGGMAPIGRLGR